MTNQQDDINKLIDQMANELREKFVDTSVNDAVMVGIHTGGVWVAERLHALLNIQQPLAQLDISFYRDDFSSIGMNPQVKPSKLPVSVDDAHIILVDDILHTGRTIRAALNEIFDYGRPASVTLAVLGNRDVQVQLITDGTPQGIGSRRFAVHEMHVSRPLLSSAEPCHEVIAVSVGRQQIQLHDLGANGHVAAVDLDLGGAVGQ